MKTPLFLISFLGLFIFNSCNKESAFDCVKTTGDIVKEERYVNGFKKILLQDNVNIILVQNQTGKIILEGGKNLLPKIKTDLSDTTITVKNSNTCDWVRSYDIPINLYVGVNQLGFIEHRGSGTISTQGLIQVDTFRIANWAKGEITINVDTKFLGYLSADLSTNHITGHATKLAAFCFGLAKLDASGLSTDEVYVITSAQGDALVQCDGLLQAQISGTGNVYYTGTPTAIETRIRVPEPLSNNLSELYILRRNVRMF